jgi:hypothetical protein
LIIEILSKPGTLTIPVFAGIPDEFILLWLQSKTRDELRDNFHSHLASARCRKSGNRLNGFQIEVPPHEHLAQARCEQEKKPAFENRQFTLPPLRDARLS